MRARAEAIRLVLHASKTEFVDERIEFPDWPKLKPTIPGGKLPVLQVTNPDDGKTVYYEESMAIARWIAKKNKMMGDNDEEYYMIERIIGQCADLDKEFFKVFMAPADAKEKVSKEILQSTVPQILDTICKTLAKSGGTFVAGAKVTFGDLCLIASIDHAIKADPMMVKDKYGALMAHREEVFKQLPAVRDHVNSRPDTAF